MNIIYLSACLFLLCANVVLATFEVPPDEDICAAFSSFGEIYNFNLDNTHQELALQEQQITKRLLEKSGNAHKKNNVVIASLTIILEDKTGQFAVKTFPIGVPQDINKNNPPKYKVFESAVTLDVYKGNKLNSAYEFDSKVLEIPLLLDYINALWGNKNASEDQWQPRSDLTKWEQEKIWPEFIHFQEEIVPLLEELKKHLTLSTLSLNSLPSLSSSLNDFAFLLTKQNERDQFNQAEIVKMNILRTNYEADILNLIERSKNITNSLNVVKTKLKTSETYIKKFYNYFWHSEQRLIYFLTSNASSTFWEDTITDLFPDNEDMGEYLVKGVFFNFHSRLNFCETCRRALVRACSLKGLLYTTLQKKLGKSRLMPDFFLKPCGSFRVRYRAQLNNISYWMSYNVLYPNSCFQEKDIFAPQCLAIKRIVFGSQDEIEADEAYRNALISNQESKNAHMREIEELENLYISLSQKIFSKIY